MSGIGYFVYVAIIILIIFVFLIALRKRIKLIYSRIVGRFVNYIFDTYYQEAKKEFNNKRYHKAINSIKKLLSIKISFDDKKIIKAYTICAQSKLNLKDLRGSINEWKKILEYEPNNVEVINKIGALYYELKNHDEAHKQWRKSSDLGSNKAQELMKSSKKELKDLKEKTKKATSKNIDHEKRDKSKKNKKSRNEKGKEKENKEIGEKDLKESAIKPTKFISKKESTDKEAINKAESKDVEPKNAKFSNAKEVVTIKKKQSENLPPVVRETVQQEREILTVKYTSKKKTSLNQYPVFRLPKFGCVVRSHRKGSTKRRGFKEVDFENNIKQYFAINLEIHGSIRLNTGAKTRPYEPDIAILDYTSGKNIRINVEIDEPYAGITRQPTHCDGENSLRDSYYVDRGWIVIRFSEYQVHTKTESCLKFIAEVINSIDPQFKIPQKLQAADDLSAEEFWSILQAQKWERENYREKYLNHTFSPIEEKEETVERDFDEAERAEEDLVEPSVIGVQEKTKAIGFNKKNAHPRDRRINFYPEPHVYTIDNVAAVSASSLVSKFFPVFDTKYWAERKAIDFGMTALEVEIMWADKGNDAMLKGTELHQQIEKFYLGMEFSELTDFQLFKSFHEHHQHLTPYRSEWRIFDEENLIAGTIDLIAINGSNSYDMYDWKRSKKVVDSFGNPITSNNWQRGVGKLSHIDDTSFNRYSLQQSLYRYILERKYGINVNNMYLVVLHPNYGRYHKVQTPYLIEEVQYMLNTL